MGQKTNANIFRLGINKNEWKSKYFETNSEEYSLYTFQDLEMKKYIKRFLNIKGLLFHNYKLRFTKNTLYIFISYYITSKVIYFINKININEKIKLIKKPKLQKLKKSDLKKNKTYPKRVKILKKIKKNFQINPYNNIKSIKSQNYIELLLESLSKFTKQKFNIIITFQNLNKGLSLKLNNIQTKLLKKKLMQLRQYSRNSFFKETINIILIVLTIKNSARLFAEFIGSKLTNMKRHNFFLIFLKRTLTIFITSSFSKILGIKIAIRGRFNGAPRARNKIILVGKVPVQTIDAKIDYYQSTAFTPNGTFGIKVWVCEI